MERDEKPPLDNTKSKSSYCPDFSQIPLSSLIALAQRFELGEKKYGRDNWRKSLKDPAYLLERLNHIIYHAKKLQGKIEGTLPWNVDDDCGAILWGGAFVCEALIAQGLDKHIDPKAEV